MKYCTRCESKKDNSLFSKHKGRVDGLSHSCKECTKTYMTKYRADNKESVYNSGVKYRSLNKEKCRTESSLWKKANPDNVKANNSRYKRNNKGKVNSDTALRYAAKTKSTPSWADKELIKDMYIEAQYQNMQVDHIVPLNSKTVCGLHWEGNMQLLTPKDNMSKGNRYWEGM